jgi:Replication initiator protein, pSAM2
LFAIVDCLLDVTLTCCYDAESNSGFCEAHRCSFGTVEVGAGVDYFVGQVLGHAVFGQVPVGPADHPRRADRRQRHPRHGRRAPVRVRHPHRPRFGPVHTTRTGPRGRPLPCRPRRDPGARRCPHERDISCPRIHRDGDPRLGQPLCPDCYDYTGHVLFNAWAPELWRRFTIYLPRQLARLTGQTQKQLRKQVRARFVKVAEYQARGLVHYHAVIRLDAAGEDCQPPPARYDAALLSQAIRQAAAAVSCDSAVLLLQAIRRALAPELRDTAPDPVIDPGLRRILRFGTQIDTRVIRTAPGLPGTGSALSAQAVANYIAKYATKTISAPGLPDHPVKGPAAIAALRCGPHHKRLISVCWDLGKHPDAASLGLNRWTHMLGYRGHFLTKSRRYSTSFTQLRRARITHRRTQRHPDGEKDPWGRDLDQATVLVLAQWRYAGTGHTTTAEHALALAAATRAREHDQVAREELMSA